MASTYVEQAVLQLNDRTSANARKINKELTKLYGTADKLKKSFASIKAPTFSSSSISKMTRDIRNLARAQKTLSQAANGKSIKFNIPNIPQAKIDKINQLTQALRNYTRAAGRVPGNVRINPNVSGGGRGNNRGGGGGGPLPFSGGGGGGVWSFNINPLRIWSAGFIYHLGYTIESSITEGFKKGIVATDTSQMRLKALGYTPDQVKDIEKSITGIVKENPYYNRSDIRTLYAELGPTLGKDPMKSEPLVRMAAEYGNVLLRQGKTADEAFSGIRALFKTLDNINRLQDQDGNIDPQATEYLRVIAQETIRAGGDIDPERINTATIFARTYGKTMTPEGFRVLINNLESMGRVAGSSLNRMVQSFSGTTTKQAMQEQAEWGLITLGQADSGSVGKKKTTTVVRESTLDEDLLRQDANAWVVKNLIPRLLERGVDLNKPEQTAKALSPLLGSVVAQDMALNLATWQAEFQSAVEAAKNTVTDPALVRGNLNESPVIAAMSTWRQFEQLLGDTGHALGNVFIPAMNKVRDTIMSISNFVAGPDGSGSAKNAGIVLGGAAAGSIFAAKGMSSLLGITGLRVAGLELQGSAAALTRAAVALGGASVGGPGIGSKSNGPWKVVNGAAKAAPFIGAAVIADEMAQEQSETYKALRTANNTILKESLMLMPNLIGKANADSTFFWKEFFKIPTREEFKAAMGIETKASAVSDSGAISIDPESINAAQIGMEAAFNNGKAVLDGSNQELMTVFTQGSANLNTVGTTIDGAASRFGPTAGQGILGVASQFGNQAAAAFVARAKGLNIGVQATGNTGPDVGANPPLN